MAWFTTILTKLEELKTLIQSSGGGGEAVDLTTLEQDVAAIKANAASFGTPKETPTVYNVTCTEADTEYSQLLPDGTKGYSVSIQDGSADKNFRIAWVTGKVAAPTAPYRKYAANVEAYDDGLNLQGKTLYIASSEAGKVAQIEVWG